MANLAPLLVPSIGQIDDVVFLKDVDILDGLSNIIKSEAHLRKNSSNYCKRKNNWSNQILLNPRLELYEWSGEIQDVIVNMRAGMGIIYLDNERQNYEQ